MIASWIRKWRDPKPCNDYLTRLDSKELANLQDAVRNGMIGVRMDINKASQHLLRASKRLKEIEARLNDDLR